MLSISGFVDNVTFSRSGPHGASYAFFSGDIITETADTTASIQTKFCSTTISTHRGLSTINGAEVCYLHCLVLCICCTVCCITNTHNKEILDSKPPPPYATRDEYLLVVIFEQSLVEILAVVLCQGHRS